MTSKPDQHYVKVAWLLICGCTLFRFFYTGTFFLVPDETYYWQWSRYISLGYHDHPPMIAWTIKLATLVVGQTERAVRLPAVLALAATSGYLFLAAKRWFGAKAGFFATLMSQSILGFNVAGILATPDGLQLAGWAGACYHVAVAYETNRPSEWLLGGAWFGFGMLSKLTMVMFPPLAFLFGILHPPYRRRLGGIWPYAGILLGLLLFIPVIVWNIDNGWNTLRHLAYKGGADEQITFQLRYLDDYIGSQVVLLSPVVFVLLMLTWFVPLKKSNADRHWALTYFFFTSFPVVAGFAVLSLNTHVEGNWAASGYFGAVVIVAAVVSIRKGKRRITDKLWPWAVGTSYFLTLLVLLQLAWPLLPIPIRLDRLAAETTGWDVLGKNIHSLWQTMPDPEKTFIFGLRYQDASTLAFYTPGRPKTVSINRWKRPNAYDYWWNDASLIGKDAVGISANSPEHLERLRRIFKTVAPVKRIVIYRHAPFWQRKREPPLSEYLIYRAWEFKGCHRWTPRNADDLRAGEKQ
jgi:4-amino-4-deoxy-L-arabinose transferase-like glycosyltransferase